MMAQIYYFSVKPQSKNQPFSRFFLKTAEFSEGAKILFASFTANSISSHQQIHLKNDSCFNYVISV
jgi:hypothetical protein